MIVDKVLAVIRIAVRIREFFKEYFYRWKFDEVLTETKMHSIFARHGLQSTHDHDPVKGLKLGRTF